MEHWLQLRVVKTTSSQRGRPLSDPDLAARQAAALAAALAAQPVAPPVQQAPPPMPQIPLPIRTRLGGGWGFLGEHENQQYEASKTQRSNLLVFHLRTAVISRRAQKASVVKEKKRLQELEELAVKVAKASTENLKTRMSRLAKILPRRRKRSSRKTTGLANKNGSVFETAKTQLPDPQQNSC